MLEVSFKYDIDILTISEKIEDVSKHVKQSCGRNSFAIIKYIIEPTDSDNGIIFENKAKIEEKYKDNNKFKDDFDIYVQSVIEGINEAVSCLYKENGKLIKNVKITLLELLIHESDSWEMSYRFVGYLIIKKHFFINQ